MKEWLLGKTQEELTALCIGMGLPRFTGGQIAQWVYKKGVTEIGQMTNLSMTAREKLGEKYQVGGPEPLTSQLSSDGTRKYLFPSLKAATTGIEAVVIPDDDRATLCISSQAGCQMGCQFCMTARMGFRGNLTAGEIAGQFLRVEETGSLTNVVYMGMGEPFNNWQEVSRSLEIFTSDWGFAWSPRRITVSSVGILPMLDTFMHTTQAHLAISLHNPFDAERTLLMPVQKTYPISRVVRQLRQYDFHGQRRLSFEYIMFDGWNDTQRHAAALLQLLRGLECRINLIRFHAIPDFPMKPSPDPVIEAFKERLNNAGLITTVRASRGMDILAACGMLSGKQLNAQ